MTVNMFIFKYKFQQAQLITDKMQIAQSFCQAKLSPPAFQSKSVVFFFLS